MAKAGTGHRLTSALIWGFMVAVFAVIFALQDVLRADNPQASAYTDTTILGICHALGGAIAGYLLAGLFGRDGVGGWLIALLGAIVVVVLGGLFGGVFAALYGAVTGTSDLATDVIRIGLGAVTAPLAIAESPWLAPLWAAVAAAAHLACRGARG